MSRPTAHRLRPLLGVFLVAISALASGCAAVGESPRAGAGSSQEVAIDSEQRAQLAQAVSRAALRVQDGERFGRAVRQGSVPTELPPRARVIAAVEARPAHMTAADRAISGATAVEDDFLQSDARERFDSCLSAGLQSAVREHIEAGMGDGVSVGDGAVAGATTCVQALYPADSDALADVVEIANDKIVAQWSRLASIRMPTLSETLNWLLYISYRLHPSDA